MDLVQLTALHCKNKQVMALLCLWRNAALYSFVDQAPVTLESTRSWLAQTCVDRVLYLVVVDDVPYGHVGLKNIYRGLSAEIDNVLRGVSGSPGLMSSAVKELMSLVYRAHGISFFWLRVRLDNARAVRFYEKLGFVRCFVMVDRGVELLVMSHRLSLLEPGL